MMITGNEVNLSSNPEPKGEDCKRVGINVNSQFKIALFNKARLDGTDVNKLTRQFWKMYVDGEFQLKEQS